MSLCFDCGKVNKDDALAKAKQAAKKTALTTNEPQAIYLDGADYKHISAFYAYANGIAVIEVLSAHR